MSSVRCSNRGPWPVVMLMVILCLAPAGPAWGDPIQVTTTDASHATECTLAEAIAIANAGLPTGSNDDCLWDGVGDPVIALEEAIYQTDEDDLPFVISSGVTMSITGVGGSTGATIARDANAYSNRLFKVRGVLNLSNVTVTGGNTEFKDAAIKVFGSGTLNLSTCRFDGNVATTRGGAVVSYGTLSVTDCIFDDNSALDGGALYVGNGSTSTLVGSTFVDNDATSGGAIYSNSGSTGDLGIENSTFSANDASSFGGAIYQRSGYILAERCTFKGNLAPSSDGGTFYRESSAQEDLDLGGSAVAGTSLCFGKINSLGNNAFEDSTCSLTATGDQVVPDLHLSDLVDNHGGLTPVHVPLCPWTGTDGACDSPLIEQYTCEAGSRDQRGQFDRNVDEAGDLCDIGAYESICSGAFTYPENNFVLLHAYQIEGATQLLDNGGCYGHTLSFEPEPETETCTVDWIIHGSLQLEIDDVIHISFENDCKYPNEDPVDCFANPEDCAEHCSLDDPEGWNESRDATTGEFLGFDVPCDIAPDFKFRYVVEYHHSSAPDVKLHWDPRNPIVQ